MSAIVSLAPGSQLPAYLQRGDRAAMVAMNSDVISSGLGFPILSIKGKVFTLVKGQEKKILTKVDDPDEVLQNIVLAVARANSRTRVFYMKGYKDGDEGVSARPDCYSNDGATPASDAQHPQSKSCQGCKHSVWGSKVSTDGQEAKGTACTVNTRLAVVDPDKIEDITEDDPQVLLLRVPAGSRKNFEEIVKKAEARGIPYNALVLKVGFDKEAPSPKLTFKVQGLLSDEAYATLNGMREHDVVKEIVGLGPQRAALPAPAPTPDGDDVDADLDAALQAKAPAPAPVAETPKRKAPAPAPKAEPADDGFGEADAPAPAPAPKPRTKAPAAEPAAPAEADNLLEGLDDLLGASDD